MPDKKRVYLDSCVFLTYINNDDDRAPTIEAILAEGRGSIQLFTSELTIVEVAFGQLEQSKQALDAETEGRINKLWLPGTPINLVEYYRLIGDDAKALIRLAITKGWSLSAMDAIHLSTALRMEVAEFHTYDTGLPKYSNDVGFVVCEPYTTAPMLDLA